MKLRYKYAVVRFCYDLTDPKGPSIPVGALLVGLSDHMGVAAATSFSDVMAKGLDPISSAIMKDLLEVMKDHVDQAFGASDDVDVDDVLGTLQRSLRNSLFVSDVSSEHVIEAENAKEAQEKAVSALLDAYGSALVQATEQLTRAAAETDEEPPYLLEPPPGFLPTLFWPLGHMRERQSTPPS